MKKWDHYQRKNYQIGFQKQYNNNYSLLLESSFKNLIYSNTKYWVQTEDFITLVKSDVTEKNKSTKSKIACTLKIL